MFLNIDFLTFVRILLVNKTLVESVQFGKFLVPPPKGIGLSVGIWVVVEKKSIKAYISNLSFLLSLEPFKKLWWWVVRGRWWVVVVVVVESDFNVKLWPEPS